MFQCIHCQRQFSKKFSLQRHNKICEGKNYSCSRCFKTFPYKNICLKHEKTCIGQPICKICGCKYSCKFSLERHEKKCDDKQYSCNSCQVTFRRIRDWRNHTKTCLKCKICQTKCQSQEDLDQHISNHVQKCRKAKRALKRAVTTLRATHKNKRATIQLGEFFLLCYYFTRFHKSLQEIYR